MHITRPVKLNLHLFDVSTGRNLHRCPLGKNFDRFNIFNFIHSNRLAGRNFYLRQPSAKIKQMITKQHQHDRTAYSPASHQKRHWFEISPHSQCFQPHAITTCSFEIQSSKHKKRIVYYLSLYHKTVERQRKELPVCRLFCNSSPAKPLTQTGGRISSRRY